MVDGDNDDEYDDDDIMMKMRKMMIRWDARCQGSCPLAALSCLPATVKQVQPFNC